MGINCVIIYMIHCIQYKLCNLSSFIFTFFWLTTNEVLSSSESCMKIISNLIESVWSSDIYLITICLLGLELKYFTSLLLLQLKVLTKAVHVQNHEKPNFYVATCYICTIIKLIQDICSDRFVAIWLHCSAKEEERPVSKPERFHLGLGQAIKMTASIWSKFKSRWIESKQTLIWVFGLL